MVNCCKNCRQASMYTGYDDFYCRSYRSYMRAEEYNCNKFKEKGYSYVPDEEADMYDIPESYIVGHIPGDS